MEEKKYVYETKDNEYQFKLSQFEGPLDLLLHLVKEAKIDIKDIFVSEITEQYLKYMETITEEDVERSGEFIEMAATLIEIKSKKILPKQEELPEGEETEEQRLIRRLEEYKLFKEQSEKLKQIEDVDRMFKNPEPGSGDIKYVLGSLSFDGLLESFSKLLARVQARAASIQEKKIEKERFTVAQKIAQIKDRLTEKKKVYFSELFEDATDKIEVINTFLALLELLKHQVVKAVQKGNFEDIIIEKQENNGQWTD